MSNDLTTPQSPSTPLPTEVVPHWNPQVGPETQGLSLPEGAQQQIIREGLHILSRCVNPSGPPTIRTGIAVGYVQSGKTTSFTTVAALARDNGYRMVIVIAGTNISLFNQNRTRLVEALRLESRPRNTPWRHVSQPKISENSHSTIINTLAQWNAPTATTEERRTVIVTVMKQHQRLGDLHDVLCHVDLHNVPTLIIDDEGDQAGLNTLINQGDESTTYQRLIAIKARLPLHAYLQYTATPQAPLLINIIDLLSPDFAVVLTPGSGYVGGVDFFTRNPRLVRVIPQQQIPSNQNLLISPPESLLEAMRIFYIGVAIGYITSQPNRNCSMMVHPSQKTDPHRQYYHWVDSAKSQWLEILDLPSEDPDRVDLMEQFRSAYDDIASTMSNIPAITSVIDNLRRAISQTEICEVNTRRNNKTPQINWGQSYSWILVGGQSMDRGFTVEGLTVTYMPRNLGIGNADTIQQRARFFGYKRDFLGLCRVFVGREVRQAFENYVDHEEDIRSQLTQFSDQGRPLSEWRREFFLDRTMRPTRANVLDIAYSHIRLGNEWIYPNAPHESNEAVAYNRTLLQQLQETYQFGPYSGLDLRQNSLRNLVIENISLQTVHEELLTRFRVSNPDDSQRFSALLRLVQFHLGQYPNAQCSLFLMAEGTPRNRRYRNGRFPQLFQGRQYAILDDVRQVVYPAERDIRGDSGISIHIGYLHLNDDQEIRIAQNIPYLAVWVPSELARDTLTQPQGNV